MYNQMLDGNSAAELEHDAPRTAMQLIHESIRIEENINRWAMVRDQLLRGESVESNFGLRFTLNERLSDEYEEFADLSDKGFDVAASYRNGELNPDVRKLVYREACTLASIVVG